MRIVAAILGACFAVTAWAQQAGGYSAGPGLSPMAAPADESDAGVADSPPFTTRIHSYRASPAFTQDREFTTTRMWVLDPGVFTVEQWWTGYWGSPNDHFFQTELEWGVVHHVQLDLYANYEFNQRADGTYQVAVGGHTGIAAEVRVALGDFWGQIPGNPTLYFELTSQYYNSPRAEFRLLLGDTVLTPKLLGALNLAFERNIFRDSSTGIDYEIKADVGLNYEVVKGILRLGAEGVFGFDSHGTVDAQGKTLLHPVAQLGPSFLLTEPKKRVKLLGALLHGFADWDPGWTSVLIVSTTFGGS